MGMAAPIAPQVDYGPANGSMVAPIPPHVDYGPANGWTAPSGQPYGAPPMMPWGSPTAMQYPFFKTQPCPYHRQGMCQMGQGCFYAHSPSELRQLPAQAMM